MTTQQYNSPSRVGCSVMSVTCNRFGPSRRKSRVTRSVTVLAAGTRMARRRSGSPVRPERHISNATVLRETTLPTMQTPLRDPPRRGHIPHRSSRLQQVQGTPPELRRIRLRHDNDLLHKIVEPYRSPHTRARQTGATSVSVLRVEPQWWPIWPPAIRRHSAEPSAPTGLYAVRVQACQRKDVTEMPLRPWGAKDTGGGQPRSAGMPSASGCSVQMRGVLLVGRAAGVADADRVHSVSGVHAVQCSG
jgi:hypothetical protein